jgi:prophage maintenance system killer protein
LVYDQQDNAAGLATTPLFGIAQNHPFVQGNKRTRFEAALIFLRVDGWRLDLEVDATLGDAIVGPLADDAKRDTFAILLSQGMRPGAA